MALDDYAAMSNDRLADLVEQIATSELHEHRGVLLLEAARRLRPTPEAICRNCGQPIGVHSIFHDPPAEPPHLQEASFAFATHGVYCPIGPEGNGS